jgi:hypothetical protein
VALIKFFVNLLKKIFKLFGGAKKKGKGAQAQSDRQPGERRIGIYGPSNVGKSVFFTMLYKACRHDQEFRLDPEDPATGKQLINNLNILRSGEWLPGTVEETQLNFKAAIRGGSQFPFSTRDYKGETIDLEQDSTAKEALIRYFQSCDAILFLLSPEMIADPRKCEREMMNFTVMINQVTEGGGKGLRIPIGLMITKADGIAGFENESQVALIGRKADYLKAKSFKEFVDGICNQYHVARNIVFQEQVRKTLGNLALFFDFLMTLSMEFQVFFVSSVGRVRKSETQDGKLITRPPEDPDGIGVKAPFLWVVETIRRKEKIEAVNGVRRFVFRLALVVLAFYSVFYGLHLLPTRHALTTMVAEDVSDDRIAELLQKQARRWIVRNFEFFALPGAGAGDVSSKAAEVDARYRAHLFLTRDLPQMPVAQMKSLAESIGSDAWQREHRWYANLAGRYQSALEEGVWRGIAGHNRDVTHRLQAWAAPYVRMPEAAPVDVVDSCRVYRDQLVPIKGNLRAEYDEHVRQCDEICQGLSVGRSVRGLLNEWRDILKSLESMCELNSPQGPDLIALRTRVQAFRANAATAGTLEVQPFLQTAEQLDDRLFRMAYVVVPENASEAPAILQQLRNESEGDLKPIGAWAVRRLRGQGDAELARKAAGLGQEIAKRRDSGNSADLGWFEDPVTEQRVREQTGLIGARAQAAERFKKNLSEMKSEGVGLQMKVKTAPEGFVVVCWDPVAEDWSGSQAAPGFAVPVRWVPGKRLRLGLQRAGAPKVEPCGEVNGRIFDLHGVPQAVACPGAGGAETTVTFEGIDKLVQERLVLPLGEAFPPE